MPAGLEPDLLLERPVEVDRVHHHLGQADGAAQLPDEAGRVEGRAAREVGALAEDDVVPAEPREPVEDRGAADASADDDGARGVPHAGTSGARAILRAWSSSSIRASVVLVAVEGDLLLVRQSRPGRLGMTLELPSGKLEPGEAPADAAVRELAEECGLAAEVARARDVLGRAGLLRRSSCTSSRRAASARPDPAELDDDEDIEVERLPLVGAWASSPTPSRRRARPLARTSERAVGLARRPRALARRGRGGGDELAIALVVLASVAGPGGSDRRGRGARREPAGASPARGRRRSRSAASTSTAAR